MVVFVRLCADNLPEEQVSLLQQVADAEEQHEELHPGPQGTIQPVFEFSDAPFITMPEFGIYFLSVMDDENPMGWRVSITPSPAIPHMGPGPRITRSISLTGATWCSARRGAI
jgi:hypothetical protein